MTRQRERHDQCPQCGEPKMVMSALCRSCNGKLHCGPLSGQWLGEAAQDKAKRHRARMLFPLGPCEKCGAKGVDRHHRDGDTGNNVPSNIRILCRRCHMAEDGRLVQLPHYPDPIRHLPRKTFCLRGHPLENNNLMWSKDGKRRCRRCAEAHNRRRHARRSA